MILLRLLPRPGYLDACSSTPVERSDHTEVCHGRIIDYPWLPTIFISNLQRTWLLGAARVTMLPTRSTIGCQKPRAMTPATPSTRISLRLFGRAPLKSDVPSTLALLAQSLIPRMECVLSHLCSSPDLTSRCYTDFSIRRVRIQSAGQCHR